ncbi:family 76 glycoside hydrolase [Xylariaceae sp. FL0255]|nr:family 76 glycoside hydrolase [Xylariaceae sp. FL0255]
MWLDTPLACRCRLTSPLAIVRKAFVSPDSPNMRLLRTSSLSILCLLSGQVLGALEVNFNDQASIKAAALLKAQDLLSFYHGDEPGWVPGILPGPPPAGDYYWWQGGAMWGALLDYRHATGDNQFDDVVSTALQFQVGDDRDYLPANWSASMGNDDQAFWGFASMLAAETGFSDPPADDPQWLALTQAVFNEQSNIDRRAPETGGKCDWGLRWQVYSTNNGWDYVNTVANACYFNIGARLARYTSNDTYGDLAEKTWDFLESVGYINDQFDVYDGAHLPSCTDINKAQFSYNTAMMLQGCAFMYNHTNANATWKTRLDGLSDNILTIFFRDGIAYEPSCEPSPGSCNSDMESYRGYMHRWMANSIQLAPYLHDKFMPILLSSAQAAVKQCTGGSNGRMCGFHWTTGTYDGLLSASLEMNVLGALTALILPGTTPPLTSDTGGTSVGDPNAGQPKTTLKIWAPVTTADRTGAGVLTAVLALGAGAVFAWMSID